MSKFFPTATCPVCGAERQNSLLGMNAHLTGHVQRGEITEDTKREVRTKLFPHAYRKFLKQKRLGMIREIAGGLA